MKGEVVLSGRVLRLVALAAGAGLALAFVVPSPGAALDTDEVLAIAARSLARFKLPRSIQVRAELPHTVTGKVMKWRLRESGD